MANPASGPLQFSSNPVGSRYVDVEKMGRIFLTPKVMLTNFMLAAILLLLFEGRLPLSSGLVDQFVSVSIILKWYLSVSITLTPTQPRTMRFSTSHRQNKIKNSISKKLACRDWQILSPEGCNAQFRWARCEEHSSLHAVTPDAKIAAACLRPRRWTKSHGIKLCLRHSK